MPIRVCLLAIIGVCLKERTKQAEKKEKKEKKKRNDDEEGEGEGEEEDEEESPEEWGFYDDDNEFFFRPREAQKAFAHFKYLYINRIQFIGLHQRAGEGQDAPREDTKPQISKKTAQIANQKRQKLVGEGKEINLIEILLHPGKRQERIQALEETKNENELKECSFKPKTLKYKGSAMMKETSGDKCIDLFSKVGQGSIRDKHTKTSNEY